MSPVIKKTRKNSLQDLLNALIKFVTLLEGQGEKSAADDLRIAAADLQKYQTDSLEFDAAINLILESYEGEHELKAYTLRRQSKESKWTEAEELYLVSINVFNLAKRLEKKKN
ncbi:MAG: hypothetical protein HYW48_10815 [Deltaproteobacteria bacterium]|nr:hypothetical protein [Deltaproteobacteria bacterium]